MTGAGRLARPAAPAPRAGRSGQPVRAGWACTGRVEAVVAT